MASLLKPNQCLKCDNKENFIHLRKPERWACGNCDEVIVQRPGRGESGVCRDCGAKKEDGVQFKKNKNQCMECYAIYQNKYREKRKDDLNSNKRRWYADNQKELRIRARDYVQQSPERFLIDLARRTRHTAQKRKKEKAEYNIEHKDLQEIYDSKNGLCNITGLKMKHEYGSLYSISVDRIDSDKGYIKGNVQLVCKGANFLKNKHTQEETLKFLDDYFEARAGSNVLKYVKSRERRFHECDCGRIVTDDEWDSDGNWCNNCLERYWEEKDNQY